MSEKLFFLKWCYRKAVQNIKSWDNWMWAWLSTCFFGSMYFNSTKGSLTETISHGMLMAIILFYWVGYTLIYNGVKTAWSAYQDEKQRVINILGERNESSTNSR